MIINSIISLIQETNEMRPRIRVKVFAFNKEKTKILAHLRKEPIIPKLPAGAVDKGETFIDAAKREMMEESGWIAKNFKYVNIPGNWKLNISKKDQEKYFNKKKLDEDIISETNICVVCEAVKYNPNSNHGSQNDEDEFDLYDINLIKELTKNSVPMNERVNFQKQFRLACFKQLGF